MSVIAAFFSSQRNAAGLVNVSLIGFLHAGLPVEIKEKNIAD